MASSSACKGCGEQLDWEQENGKWTAYEAETGERHRCPNYQAIRQQKVERQPSQPLVRTTPPDEYDMLRVLNRIESLLKRLVELAESPAVRTSERSTLPY